ncbi:MAG TPA: CBS domain-containing protein [Jiangellales bacterium]|nr:CBS domain-containing protein [Jiangellales bacterium]
MSRFKVKDVMTTDVASVGDGAGFREIAEILAERQISAVPVVDASRRVVGVVSEADLLHKLEFAGESIAARLFEGRRHRRARTKAAGDDAKGLMTTPALTVKVRTSLVEAARLMEAEGVKRLPVVDDEGHLIGIVSRADLLKVFVQPDQKIRDEVLEQVFGRALWLEPSKITVEVHDGLVTLDGELETKSQVTAAVHLTRAVDGVVDVVDRLTYRYDDTAERNAYRFAATP